jgi:hypothetical protein
MALLDVLVLAKSRIFVGHPYSTMSVLCEQLRVLQGLSPDSTHYMDMPVSENNVRLMEWLVRFAKEFRPVTK